MRETLRYQGDRFHVVHIEPDAASGLPSRDVIRHPGAVVIIPLLDDQHLCVIENYRLSVARTLIELPAGTRQAGEPPELTASRELEEETGLRAGRLDYLGMLLMSPGILDEKMYVFLAQDLQHTAQRLEPDERITTLKVSINEAYRWIADGKIEDAKSLAALMLFDLKRRGDVASQTSPV